MENTEVMTVVENEVVEPIIEEIAEAKSDAAFNTTAAKGFAAGALACIAAYALYRYVGKPLAKKWSASRAAKKRERALKQAGIDPDTTVCVVDEEVEDSK